jgi:Flp pilus assembly protein TadG
MPTPRSRRRRDDRGSAAIEAVIGVTAFGLFIAMTAAGGRVALGRQAVETAANDAARAASIARTSSEASADARTAAIGSLDDQDIKCLTTSVQVDTSGFSAPIGTTAQVTATVSCTVKLSDLAVPGMPGSRTITETVSSPIDAFRERR